MRATVENFDHVHGELMVKIHAGNAAAPCFGDISLDRASQKILGPDGTAQLTGKEYIILWLLVRARGRFITCDEIMYFLYDDTDNDIPLGNTIQVFVSRVRKKMRSVEATVGIETFRGFGYLLV